jgi:hypothetical protein
MNTNKTNTESEAVRRSEIVEAVNRNILVLLENSFNHGVKTLPPSTSSGMVEMQGYFAKLRR